MRGMASAAAQPLRDEPAWPALAGGAGTPRIVFLLDASSRLERRLLAEWMQRHRPETASARDFEAIEIPPTRRRRMVAIGALEARLAAGDDVVLAPLRVAWLAPKRDGIRRVRFVDLLKLGDPRDPGVLRQHAILRRERDRCRIVAGEPAPLSELRARWREACFASDEPTTGLA
jgi:glycerol-3-phosphate O-acyltransferase